MTRHVAADHFVKSNSQASSLSASTRVQSVDALRGLVMIIMALDHVRDFFHAGAMSFQPDDLTRTTAALFFTRWITHLCAPVFAFTTGLGAYLWVNRGRNIEQLSQFLWKRGVWLVLLDLIVVRFSMFFSLTVGPVILSVLWALGWSMVILGFVARLPMRAIAIFSVTLIVLHNLADGIPAAAFGSAAWAWNILHQPGLIPVNGLIVLAAYPLVPWVAVVAAGFCCGPLVRMSGLQRQRYLFRAGLALTFAFVVLRWLNIYGDPQPWAVQETSGMTVLSFLRTTKYPPSLDFVLMTLGPAMLIWHWLDRREFSKYNPLIVFGRVPLFYFLLHMFLIHALTFAFAMMRYGTVGFLWNPLPSLGGPASSYPPGFGYDLPVVYGVWLLVVLLMYPLCLYFGNIKERRRDWWLSYL